MRFGEDVLCNGVKGPASTEGVEGGGYVRHHELGMIWGLPDDLRRALWVWSRAFAGKTLQMRVQSSCSIIWGAIRNEWQVMRGFERGVLDEVAGPSKK